MINKIIPSPSLFILGTQRSGTTLLARILSAHPDLWVANEMPLDKIFSSGASKEQILSNINEHFAFNHNQQNIVDFLNGDKKSKWGLKDPQLTEHLNLLKQFINSTKFIIILRDARGVVNSYMDNKWGLGTNAYTGTLRWKHEVEQQLAFMNEYPDDVILIRYEDLISNMENSLRKICEHIGLKQSKEMLEYYNQKQPYIQRKQNIGTNFKPDMNITVKWKQELSQKEIGIIELVAGNLLLENKYELTNTPVTLSALDIFYYKWHQKILGEIQIQYQLKKSLIRNFFNSFSKTSKTS